MVVSFTKGNNPDFLCAFRGNETLNKRLLLNKTNCSFEVFFPLRIEQGGKNETSKLAYPKAAHFKFTYTSHFGLVHLQ